MAVPSFDDNTLRSVSNIISDMLTHKQISEHFDSLGIKLSLNGTNKPDKIFNALRERQLQDGCGNNILGFIQHIITPKRYNEELKFERDRTLINEKLLYVGIEIDPSGRAKNVSAASTISEAKERSQKIKEKIRGMLIHGMITPYCQEEWLKENYFHAILEITKTVAEKLRQLSGYTSDGSALIDECFGLGQNNQPMLAFNSLQSESEQSEHKGFAHFIKGFFSMYRNPKAHTAKVNDPTSLEDMAEVLVVATIIHNRLDGTVRTGYR